MVRATKGVKHAFVSSGVRYDLLRSTKSRTEGELLPLEEVERRYLEWAVGKFQGDNRELAGLLGLSERTLYRRLRGLRQA